MGLESVTQREFEEVILQDCASLSSTNSERYEPLFFDALTICVSDKHRWIGSSICGNVNSFYTVLNQNLCSSKKLPFDFDVEERQCVSRGYSSGKFPFPWHTVAIITKGGAETSPVEGCWKLNAEEWALCELDRPTEHEDQWSEKWTIDDYNLFAGARCFCGEIYMPHLRVPDISL